VLMQVDEALKYLEIALGGCGGVVLPDVEHGSDRTSSNR
jgi:hypothetical protein